MDNPATSPTGQAPKSNKKWIFWGCGGCLGLILLLAIGGWFFMSSIFGAIKNSDAYKIALKRVQDSAEVQAALGTPIEEGSMGSGAVSTNNGESTAAMVFFVSGPKGKATVTVQGTKPAGGDWVFSVLQAQLLDTGKVVELSGPPAAPAPAP